MNTEWKPIASAPKDGTEILAWRHDCGQFIASYTSADSFPMTQDELDAWDEETLFAKDWFTQWPQALRLEGSEVPTLWQPMPTDPCATCNGHGMIGGPSYYAPDEGGEPCPDCSPPAPTSHPIPTGATGDRDWELACDNCNGSGHVFVKHQVAERKTDVQEFKEECECCEGRGFNIAFEDIPGIAEYVKSCRPAATVATGEDERQAFEAWFTRNDVTKDMATRAVRRGPGGDYVLMQTYTAWEVWQAARASVDAPAAGDALDKSRLDWLEQHDGRFYNKDRISSIVGVGFIVAGDLTGMRHQSVRAAIDAAIAQQSQRKEA